MYTKYEVSITYGSNVKAKVKIDNKQIDRQDKNKQIRRIMVPRPATNLTLKYVQGQGHRMLSIGRASHKDHACQISMLYH